MTWGLALSVASILWSALTKKKETNGDAVAKAAPSRISSECKLFVSGILVTVSSQYLYCTLIRNNVHYQRFKHMLYSLATGAAFDKKSLPLRQPTSLLRQPSDNNEGPQIPSAYALSTGVKEKRKGGDALSSSSSSSTVSLQSSTAPLGFASRLVAPELRNSRSHHLHVTVLHVPPQCELPSRASAAGCLEFYHVVAGTGVVSQQGIVETLELQTGDCFVVDPLSVRWISNKTKNGTVATSPLILLRVTEGGSVYSQLRFNEIHVDPNAAMRSSSSKSLEALSQGLAKVQKAAVDYYNSSSSISAKESKSQQP